MIQGDAPAAAPTRGGRAGIQQDTVQSGAVYSSGVSYGRAQAPPSEYSPQMSSAQWAAEGGLQAEERTPTSGFGDSGSSCVRLHAPAGGRNAMGTGFSWGEDPVSSRSAPGKDAYAEHMRNNSQVQLPQTAVSQSLGVGSQVVYKQIGKAGIEVPACVSCPVPPPLHASRERHGGQRGTAC